MGYTYDEDCYPFACPGKDYGRPVYMIYLSGDAPADSEGNPYGWAWFLDTGEEMG